MNTVMCKLCLSTLDNCSNEFEILDDSVKDMLHVILLKLEFEENEMPVVCKTCLENVHQAFAFKATCVDTEDRLYPYKVSANEKLDLKVVYFKERMMDETFKFDENEAVCRFCLSLTDCNTATALKSTILKYSKFFGKFMPELALDATCEAVICENCHVSLEKYEKFIKCYLEYELNMIEKRQTDWDNESKSNLQLTSCNDIKKEPEFMPKFQSLLLKTEQNMNINEYPVTHMEEGTEETLGNDVDYSLPISKMDNSEDIIKSEEIEIKWDEGSGSFSTLDRGIEWKENTCQFKSEELNFFYLTESCKTKETTEVEQQQKFCSGKCPFFNEHSKSDQLHPSPDQKQHLLSNNDDVCQLHRNDFNSAILNLNRVLETQMYKCEICAYETKYAQRFDHHMFLYHQSSTSKFNNHTDTYICKTCNYKTNSRSDLRTHYLSHKDPAKIETYKCSICAFETKRKNYIKSHMLEHKNSSEASMFTCNLCDYKTEGKNQFYTHMMKHTNPSAKAMYKCEICDHETTRLDTLNLHLLVHKDLSESKTMKCDMCTFETDNKYSLKDHTLSHKRPSEIFKCDMCDYVSKGKGRAMEHTFMHKFPSEPEMFKCDICDFKSKIKSSLDAHLLNHTVPNAEEQTFKCHICDYCSKEKERVMEHMIIHKVPSKLKIFKCGKCNFKSKIKRSVTAHMLIHSVPPEIRMYKCEMCNYESTTKYTLSRHMLIHQGTPNKRNKI